MRDWPDICGARILLDVSLPFISLRSCTLVLTSTLLFIAGPSEPPSLIIFIIIAYVPSDPSPPFQLAAAGEESQEKREGKKKEGAGTKLRRCPRLSLRFFFSREAAKVSSCVVPRSSSKLQRSSSAAVRAAA